MSQGKKEEASEEQWNSQQRKRSSPLLDPRESNITPDLAESRGTRE